MFYTAADLRYDAEQHRTWRPDGLEVPHVTAILGAVGVAVDFEEIVAVGGPRAAAVEHARLRGTAVHMDCHAYDDDDLDWDSVDPRIAPYVEAWAQFRGDYGAVPIPCGRERHVYHGLFNYTGILDGVFQVRRTTGARREPSPRRVLIDTKTGDPHDAAAHLQTAAYEGAWTAAHPDLPIDERWAVWLHPHKRKPYTVVNYTERPEGVEDFGRFLACLTVYGEQPARRRRIS